MIENSILHFIQLHFPTFGWAGSLVILLGCLIAALPYRGKNGEKYSFLNHYISELGEKGVSRLAVVFNGGMVIGGALLLPFIVGLGLTLGSWWGTIAMAAGIVAAVASIFVGIYSMDRIEPHAKAAMTYFRFGLVTILLFTLAVFLQPAQGRVIPLSVNIVGILAVLSYASFLVLVTVKARHTDEDKTLDPSEKKERPRFWLTTFLEWMVFFSTMVWFLSVALILAI